jgi:MFS family permease
LLFLLPGAIFFDLFLMKRHLSRASEKSSGGWEAAKAWRLVILFGVVSLFSDATYEGARSVLGPYLGSLGADAATIAFIAGTGELLGFALRFFSGHLADRTRHYWTITILGYLLNLLSVPALSLARGWPAAFGLTVLERVGKSLRTPARDTILSHATTLTGRGWGFGVHEALDQIGAILGPLFVAGVVASKRDYRLAFAFLGAPALLSLAGLLLAYALYPRPDRLEGQSLLHPDLSLRPGFWFFVAGLSLIGAAFADFPLVAFHLERSRILSPQEVPIFYAIAMSTDALAALFFGRLYDAIGFRVVLLVALCTLPFCPLVFLGGRWAALCGVMLWGLGLGAQESVVRASIASFAPAERRATAFGLFQMTYGIAWFSGSLLLGLLYERSILLLVLSSVVLQVLSFPPLVTAWRLQASTAS